MLEVTIDTHTHNHIHQHTCSMVTQLGLGSKVQTSNLLQINRQAHTHRHTHYIDDLPLSPIDMGQHQ